VPQGKKHQHFTKMQSAAQKDVERTFGVLQVRWKIVQNHVRTWGLETISDTMMSCIILHNMVVQDEQDGDFESIFDLPMCEGSMQWGLPFLYHMWALKGLS
jgi:hypothetical protein